MLNVAASVPPRLYVNVSLSASVADTGVPMFVFAAAFSVIERVVVSPSVNTGALLEGVGTKSFVVASIVPLVTSLPTIWQPSAVTQVYVIPSFSIKPPLANVMVTLPALPTNETPFAAVSGLQSPFGNVVISSPTLYVVMAVCCSSISIILIVTVMLSVPPLPSETEIMTKYDDFFS